MKNPWRPIGIELADGDLMQEIGESSPDRGYGQVRQISRTRARSQGDAFDIHLVRLANRRALDIHLRRPRASFRQGYHMSAFDTPSASRGWHEPSVGSVGAAITSLSPKRSTPIQSVLIHSGTLAKLRGRESPRDLVDWFNNRRLLEAIGKSRGRGREALLRHAERTSHGGVTQTKQPPGNPARFKHVKPQSRKCVLEQRRKWVTRPLAGSDGQREASARASRMLPVRCAASVQTEIGTRPSNRMSRSMPRPSGGRIGISTRRTSPARAHRDRLER